MLGTTIPVFTLIISIALGYDRLSLRRCCGVLLAAFGVIYLVNPFKANFSPNSNLGNILILVNCLAYGAYIAISKSLFKRYGALQVICWLFVLGSLTTLAPALYTGDLAAIRTAGLPLWLILAYIVLVPTVLAYYLNAYALTHVSPGTVATYIYLQPLIAFALAPQLLGERWNFRTLVASAFIFLGVFVVTKRGRSYTAKEVTERPDALAH